MPKKKPSTVKGQAESEIIEERRLILERQESAHIQSLLQGLGLHLKAEALEPLLDSLTAIVLTRYLARSQDLFQALSRDLGRDISRLVAGKAGEFSVVGRTLDDWIHCDWGTTWLDSGSKFRLEFSSGLFLTFYLDPESDLDQWNFESSQDEAVLTLGFPSGPRLLPLDIGIGEPKESDLLVQVELIPVPVGPGESVVKITYNVFRTNKAMLEKVIEQ
jgi:hypothetical protein